MKISGVLTFRAFINPSAELIILHICVIIKPIQSFGFTCFFQEAQDHLRELLLMT